MFLCLSFAAARFLRLLKHVFIVMQDGWKDVSVRPPAPISAPIQLCCGGIGSPLHRLVAHGHPLPNWRHAANPSTVGGMRPPPPRPVARPTNCGFARDLHITPSPTRWHIFPSPTSQWWLLALILFVDFVFLCLCV